MSPMSYFSLFDVINMKTNLCKNVSFTDHRNLDHHHHHYHHPLHRALHQTPKNAPQTSQAKKKKKTHKPSKKPSSPSPPTYGWKQHQSWQVG